MAAEPTTAEEYLARAIQREERAKEIESFDRPDARKLRREAELDFKRALTLEAEQRTQAA